ncbi:phenoloxidase-activating factor 2 [Folsomia candida]|uniref:Salivary plasminogen activator alpha 1 n=1 Tax=Folsomia candida TaxID=158441 RepID=A0A226EU83_FOLCA|nr:phenoloxidase-activating factor 2 [Folsomia candida]OXA61173.1 Salivary plasminogen activator alpha 1 [Folsomia candida]
MLPLSIRFHKLILALLVFVVAHAYCQECRCVTIQECGDGGGLIKPRHNATAICNEGLYYCCLILATVQPSPKCGIHDPASIPGFAYGVGNVALYREFPWLVKILGKDGQYLGSGALIDSHRVLTVAHLFQNHKPHSVVVGMHTEVARVVESTEHKDFNWVNLSNDVTILYLERNSLNLGELFPLVGKVCLPHEEEFLQGGKNCVLSTFGENGYPIIRKIKMSLLSGQDCQDQFRRTGKLGPGFHLNKKSFICAGGSEPGQDACEGHGGSPLVCKIDGRFYLAGLVSWGVTKGDCSDRGNFPGVYLNVAHYAGWIRDN